MSTDAYAEMTEAVEVRHSPTRASSFMAVGAGVVAVLTSGPLSAASLLIGLFGLGGMVVGLFARESQGLVTAGTGVIFLGVLVTGLFVDAPPALLVISTLFTVLAFDLGQNAFSIGAQMSEETDTTRGELVHAAASLAVGAVAVTAAYAVFLLAGTLPSIAALLFVLLGAVFLAWAIRS